MTNKLIIIINSLKIPKIKKILLHEMKFLVPNYICLQNLWLGGYRPQIPILSALCPQLNLLNHPPPNKIPGCATSTRGYEIHNKMLMGNLERMRKVDSPTCVSKNNETNLKRVSYKDVKLDSSGSGQDVTTFGIFLKHSNDSKCSI